MIYGKQFNLYIDWSLSVMTDIWITDIFYVHSICDMDLSCVLHISSWCISRRFVPWTFSSIDNEKNDLFLEFFFFWQFNIVDRVYWNIKSPFYRCNNWRFIDTKCARRYITAIPIIAAVSPLRNTTCAHEYGESIRPLCPSHPLRSCRLYPKFLILVIQLNPVSRPSVRF